MSIRMAHDSPKLTVVRSGGPDPCERIVLSLVHPRGRIDVSASAVVSIEPREERDLLLDTGALWTTRSPNVELRFTPEIHHRISRLSAEIVGEPLEVVVCSKSVAKPVVREPLSSLTCFCLSVWDFADAEALAEKLRARWVLSDLRVVPGPEE